MNPAFFDALGAAGPHPQLGIHADVYGPFIGSWSGEFRDFTDGARAPTASAEVHFGWVLEGRAVQDVWIVPARRDRVASASVTVRPRYGSTLRVFDVPTQTWHVLWTNPVLGTRIELVGRRDGDAVVQLGMRGTTPIRWTFSDIRPDAFLWQGHALQPDGATWQLETEFRLRRHGD
ncbi:MAG: hypothetical protein KIT73_06005 [Burkholderiales bacterium]|nr:hypothetical protein [Burkholderiales bacterium]